MQILTPHVYWAQRHGEIYLRVELSDAKNVDICLQEDNTLQFRAQGHGAKGDNQYEFSLEFLEPVKPEIRQKSTQRQVDIRIKKREVRWWERLTLQERKPLFLAPDFDRWLDESDAEMELQAKEEKINRISVESRVRKDPYLGLKKGYLFMYNLVQFLGFSWIFVNMTVRLFILGQGLFSKIFILNTDFIHHHRVTLKVAGRNVILFVIFGSLEDMQNKAVVFFVFYLWSSIEIFRYPFYMLACIGTEWKLLTWLRYSLWIPLYPLGVVAEAVAVIQSLPIFDETRLFSIPLPSVLGHSLSFSYTLQLFLVLMFLGLFINFQHLYKQRQRRYRSRKRKVH
ncbi:PREDICTED: very-long-chain (3R)-3-hydroxyacyl-CoA dehydratase-like [Cyprinodon variegatus]|uniref:very-long-chain (3R)-3-hydroxyacyl-CoA dehydratase-like n=1 Tax=Cyprinodon variegatus TaxID=28743 RepID=UPI0007425AC8|nr:PREDICTED: very-long-chain (3R)-3-hydroxyacyl-CoA dehydratase-like [Cyprinodon variegatus]